MSNKEIAEELHKPIIIKFEKGKVYSSFKDNIWAADLADIQLTLIWVGFLGIHFEVGSRKITHCLKLVRIMLET